MSALTSLLKVMDLEPLFLDTETTGLNAGEIFQIAIIDSLGNPLLNTLIKPKAAIPRDATAIHGIDNEKVVNAPTWQTISEDVLKILNGRHVVIYNAVYDRRMMHQSAEAWGMPKVDWKTHAHFVCAMEAYAEFFGDWNSYRQSYRWHKLTTAMNQQHLAWTSAHTALADCLMTLRLCEKMKRDSEKKKRDSK